MKFITLTKKFEEALEKKRKKLEGIVADVSKSYASGKLAVTFRRYFVNEYGVYNSEIVYEDIEIDDPEWDIHFEEITDFKVKRSRRKALMELAQKLFPDFKVIYLEE